MKFEDFKDTRKAREEMIFNVIDGYVDMQIPISDLEIVYDNDRVYTCPAILQVSFEDFFNEEELDMLRSKAWSDKTKGIEEADELLDMLEDLVG